MRGNYGATSNDYYFKRCYHYAAYCSVFVENWDRLCFIKDREIWTVIWGILCSEILFGSVILQQFGDSDVSVIKLRINLINVRMRDGNERILLAIRIFTFVKHARRLTYFNSWLWVTLCNQARQLDINIRGIKIELVKSFLLCLDLNA